MMDENKLQQEVENARQRGVSQDLINSRVQQIRSGVDANDYQTDPSLGGFVSNASSDIGETVRGLTQIPGMVARAISDPGSILETSGQFTKAILSEYGDLLSDPIGHAYNRPFSTLMDILPFLGDGRAALAGKAGEAGQAAKAVETAGEATRMMDVYGSRVSKAFEEAGQATPMVREYLPPIGTTKAQAEAFGTSQVPRRIPIYQKTIPSSTYEGPIMESYVKGQVPVTETLPETPPVNVEDIISGAKQAGEAAKGPSLGARTLERVFQLTPKQSERLNFPQVAQNIIDNGTVGDFDYMRRISAELTGEKGAWNQVNRQAISQIKGGLSFNPPDSAASDVLDRVTGLDVRDEGKILNDIRKTVYNTPQGEIGKFNPIDSFDVARRLQTKAAEYESKSTASAPNIQAEGIADAYKAAGKSIMDDLETQAGNQDVLSKFKTPAMQKYMDSFSKQIGNKWRNSKTIRDIRRLQSDYVRINQAMKITEYAGSTGTKAGASRMIGAIGGAMAGSALGPLGTVGGLGVGMALEPTVEAVNSAILRKVAPLIAKAYSVSGPKIQATLDTIGKAAKTGAVPTMIIGRQLSKNSDLPDTSKPDTTTQDRLPSDIKQVSMGTQPKRAVYPLENMVKDVQRDPKNRAYYQWLYATLQKTTQKTATEKVAQQRVSAMKGLLSNMIKSVDKAKGIGPVSSKLFQAGRYTGQTDTSTAQVMQNMGLLQEMLGTEAHRRGMNAQEFIRFVDNVMPKQEYDKRTFKKYLTNLTQIVNSLDEYMPMQQQDQLPDIPPESPQINVDLGE